MKKSGSARCAAYLALALACGALGACGDGGDDDPAPAGAGGQTGGTSGAGGAGTGSPAGSGGGAGASAGGGGMGAGGSSGATGGAGAGGAAASSGGDSGAAGESGSDGGAGSDGGDVDPSDVPAAGTVPIDPPSPSGCIDDVGPGGALVFADCGGDIVFNVSVPEQCMTHACGLIFDVHGWTMTGPIQEMNTGIAAIGREEGYVVVQPSAPGMSWNAAMHDSVVQDFLRLAIEVWNLETRRVHFTGFSQGGAMTFRMRCALSDVIASAAPVAMRGGTCEGDARVMDVMYVQGRADVFVADADVDSTIAALIDSGSFEMDSVLSEDDRHTWTRYTNAQGRTLEIVDHTYSSGFVGGHCFPGSLDAPGLYGCDEEAPFAHGRIVVDFFKAHPMPAP